MSDQDESSTSSRAPRASSQIISDLNTRVDAKYLDERDMNRWRAIPYATEEFAGVMLGYGPGEVPVPLRIRLNVRGRYRIWLGLYGFVNYGQLRVRLSGDRCCTRLGPPPYPSRISLPVVYEFYWKQADLTDQDLIVESGHPQPPHSYPGALTHVRLEPAGEPEAAKKGDVRFPLAITNDGSGIFGEVPHSRPEDLLETFERIPDDSCVKILLWGNGEADICNYPTRVGQCGYHRDDEQSFLMPFYRTLHRNLALWKRKGWDSLRVVRDYAKRRGWEFQVYIRMEAFTAQFPFDRICSNFFRDHPEYHCFDVKGQRVGRLSYAYPEVRNHMTDLIREMATYEPDGVCLCFVRGVPVVLYEPIMVDGFKNRHGVDPRELGELDERWLDYQGEVFTPFIEQAKRALRPGQRLSAIVPGNEFDCRRWGLDVAGWVEKGIIDDLLPCGQRFTEEDVHVDGPENLDFKFFQQLEGRERIRLIPMLYPWDTFNRDYPKWRELLFSFLDAGADGYAVWDATSGDRFDRVAKLGYHSRPEFTPRESEIRTIKLLTMNAFRFDRYHHFEVI